MLYANPRYSHIFYFSPDRLMAGVNSVGAHSENPILCMGLNFMYRNILSFNTIAERKIAFPTEVGYFSTFRRGLRGKCTYSS